MADKLLEECRIFGNRRLEALTLATLGNISLSRGDYRLASDCLGASIVIHQQQGDLASVAAVLERFIELAVAEDKFDLALRLAATAAEVRQRAGTPLRPRGQARLDQVLAPARRSAAGEKERCSLDLDEAIAAALALTGPLVEPESNSAQAGPASAITRLTAREQEVAVLIAQGCTNRQIAAALTVTEGTVASHVVHILNKLGYNSRTQVAVWATERGLLPAGWRKS